MARKALRKAQQNTRNDAETTTSSTPVETGEVSTIDAHTPENGTAVGDASEQERVEEDVAVERRSKRSRTEEKQSEEVTTLCRACGCGPVVSDASMVMLQCNSCHMHAHARCFAVPVETIEGLTSWICESCTDKSNVPHQCVFCLQAGDACMRRVETTHWPVMYRPPATEEPHWAHAICALWNPFQTTQPKAPAITSPPDEESDETKTETATRSTITPSGVASIPVDSFRARLELLVPACIHCDSSTGVRVQCRRLNCGRFFHVRCAQSSEKGYVEVVHTPFPLKHAYCDRHLQSRHDLGDLTTKLMSKTMASLIPREVTAKVHAIVRRLDSYATVDAVIVELVNLLEDMCKKGLQNSKTDPPTFSMRQLQALQLVLDHLPQLRNLYDPSMLGKTDGEVVQDPEVVHALQKAFHPQRFVRKFAGPLSQFYQCDACHEPFQERQHIFYCTSTEKTHALHWKCTKRKSAPKDRAGGSASTKKKPKSVSLVQQGHWKDIKLPKALPSIGDGVTCGVCRAPVDARGILVGRKDVARMEFVKPTSDFMFGGCFANEMDPRSASAAGLRTSRATPATTTLVGLGAMSNGARIPPKSAPRRSASGASAIADSDGEASAMLGPPKMDRINVRRTTRWLACLAQVLRLVMAAKKAAKEAQANVPQDTSKEQDENEVPSGETEKALEDVASTDDAVLSQHQVANAEGDIVTAETIEDTEMSEAPVVTEPIVDHVHPIESTGENESVSVPTEGGLEVPDEKMAINESVTPSETAQIPSKPIPSSLLPAPALAYLEEAKNVVRPYDAYALSKMEAAHRMLEEGNGPALSLLNTLIQEYTRFMYIKHTRAVAKASTEKRKREELEAQEERERERKRIDQEAELALKQQMLAMRKKQRT